MEAELNQPKRFCTMPFKGSKEKHWNEFNEFLTLIMKIGTIGKTMTSNGKTVLRNIFVVLCESVENNFIANEVEFGLEFHCSKDRTQQTGEHDYEAGDLRETTTIDDKLERPVVRLAPLFSESVFPGDKQGQ